MHDTRNRTILQTIAHRVMQEKGLEPEFSPSAIKELTDLHSAPGMAEAPAGTRDLRKLLWCSIDNDDSLDLDQLTVAVPGAGDAQGSADSGAVRILVAIADVDAVVRKDSELDKHARQNTTSVYTAAQIFPMLPERISTDLTSLKGDADRLAVVVELVVSATGETLRTDVYSAMVHNYAKLAYNSVAPWLEGKASAPQRLSAVPGLADNIRLQWRVSQLLSKTRHDNGALDLETSQTRPVFAGDELTDLREEQQNCAKELISEFMIAANGATARYLAAQRFPSIRRVVRTPKRWDRIVELAAERNAILPDSPDSVALEKFLVWARETDPAHFGDLSLSVIKLLGRGEYILLRAGEDSTGHFGLAAKDYAHSTAPNRRFPDVVIQRLVKAAAAGKPVPYAPEELARLATHCTAMEDAAKKVERQVEKSAAAMLLAPRIGDEFDAIVTGASAKGTWVRIFRPPVEGRLRDGAPRTDVGRRLRVRLVDTDVDRGFIDFDFVSTKQ